MPEEKKEEEKGASINIGFGLDGLLGQLTNLAEASGNKEAQGRVAEVKRRLGGLAEQGGESQIKGGPHVDLGGLFGGIFSDIGRLAETVAALQKASGGGSVQTFEIGGKKGVISFGGHVGSVSDLARGEGGSDFKPEPVKTSGTFTPSVPAAEAESAPEPEFHLDVIEEVDYVLVYGVVPAVANKNDIKCTIEGKVLTVIVNNIQHKVELPAEVNVEQAAASYTNGVFSVRLSKV